MLNSTAKCDRTKTDIDLLDGFFVADPSTGEWSFVCDQAPEKNADYNVPVRSILQSPEALVDWMAHLNEKTWFDAKAFFDFFTRFRKENGLFNSL